MNLIYSLITLALQSVGQIFSLLIGWIIAVHFGRVPTKQKFILSVMGGISIIWAVMALSLASPLVRSVFGIVTREAVPFYIKLIVPLASLGWICLPLINGVLGIYLRREKVSGIHVFLGYKYTPGFAFALLIMLISLPILILPPLFRGQRREHLPVMIWSNSFEVVLESLKGILLEQGISVEIKPETIWRRSPLAILALFAHDLLGDWTKKPARLLKGKGLQLIVYPTDIVIEGYPDRVVKTRNYVAKGLTFSEAYFTWDGEAHLIEKELNILRRNAKQIPYSQFLERLEELEKSLDKALIPFSEWECLYRQLLQLKVTNCIK
ncbi:MAG TPA: hypothetical protein VFF14_00535 [Candidatus Deferrimicrobium sp.]|nr:hypothetical protein [Candidatus Deferrimicrobium sp.]